MISSATRLIESEARTDVRGGARAVLVAVALHAALVAGAVVWTRAEARPAPRAVIVCDCPWLSPPPAAQLAPGPVAELAIGELPPLPVLPPVAIPLSLGGHEFQPGAFVGTPHAPVLGSPGSDGVFAPTGVEELPELLVGAPPAFPELLRRAGVEGVVVLEAIVDTAGRVEPGSVAVVTAPHPGFVAPAVAFVARALYRPARVQGRPVRVRIRQAVDFRLRR
jgi:protein TonB